MLRRIVLAALMGLVLGVFAAAQEWQRLGPEGGMVLSLAAGPGNVVYLGTSDGHVFRRQSAAEPWELSGRVGLRNDAVVSRLLVDPKEGRVVLAAVRYQHPGVGGGVFRTEDGARTWKSLGLEGEEVRALERSASEPGVLVAGTRTGVFRSRDSGQSWERISPEGDPELRNLDSLAIDPADPQVIYAGTYHLPWKTMDGGKSWKPTTAGLIDDSDIMSLRIDASNADRLFLSACSGIYRSENRGGLWSKLQGIPYAARRTQEIVQDIANPKTWYAGTTAGLWVTADSGETWERTTPADWVINSVVVLPAAAEAGERVLIGTETGGVLQSENGGRDFSAANQGFTHEVVSQLIADRSDSAHLLARMQRNRTLLWESHDAGRQWSEAPVAERNSKSGELFLPEAVSKLYASPWGWIAKLFTGEFWLLERDGEKWREWTPHPADHGGPGAANSRRATARPAPATKRPPEAGVLLEFSADSAYLAGRAGLRRCRRDGSCVALKAFPPDGKFGAVYVSRDDSELAVAADGRLGVSHDGGETAQWSDLPVSSDEVLRIHRIAFQQDPEFFLATTKGLYASGANAGSWRLLQQGLPAGQVEQFLRSGDVLAVSLRDGGFYISRDQGGSWKREDRDAERSRLAGVAEVAPGILILGTQSEGVLRWSDRSARND